MVKLLWPEPREAERQEEPTASEPPARLTRGVVAREAELPNEPRLLPNYGQGDLRLTPDGGQHMVLGKDKVEIGHSGRKTTSSFRAP